MLFGKNKGEDSFVFLYVYMINAIKFILFRSRRSRMRMRRFTMLDFA